MYLINILLDGGLNYNLILVISILSIISGILVIVNKNPIISVLFLIALFLTVALYLFILKISFIALAYLLVYVGAVSILFLFILMLINVRISELTTDNNNSIPLSIIIITIFSISFSGNSLLYGFFSLEEKTLNDKPAFLTNEPSLLENLSYTKETNENIYSVFSCMWDSILAEISHVSSLGNVIYISYAMNILIVGLILLLAMIGAISVTEKTRR